MSHENIKNALREVNLSYSAKVLDEHLVRAQREEYTFENFILSLLDDEKAHRREKRITERIKQARLRVVKTLEGYDFSFPQKINKQVVKALFGLTFIREKQNVILLGPPGIGKTHIAIALCYAACQNAFSCRFTTAMNLINELNASISDNSFLGLLKRYAAFDLLVVDELGYLPVDKQGSDLLFQIISNRYETASVVVTTNRPFKEWGQIFNGDAALAGALIDRLAHHGIIIAIEGDSYRVGKR